MGLMPRRSTERIPDEFLPTSAEQEWITKFRPHSADVLLVNIARSCCDGFRPTDDEAQCCLNVLARSINERDWKAEVLATWILGFAQPSDIFSEETRHQIINLASPGGLSYRRTVETLNRTIYFSAQLCLILGAFAGIGVIVQFLGYVSGIQGLILLLAGILGGAVAGCMGVYLLTPVLFPVMAVSRKRQEKQIQKAALQSLRRWNDPRVLGTIARASLKADTALLRQIQTTFASLLTPLTPDYYGAMPAGTTENLCRALEDSDEFLKPDILNPNATTRAKLHARFAQDLLQALERVGGGEAAKYVRAVIEANYHSEVVGLAKRVLPILTEREHEETARTTLLRHSSLPAPADEMLRAASSSSTDNDNATLIRPVL